MLFPDTVPVYLTTPTAPKLIVLPVRLPVMATLSGGDDSMIVPSTAEPVSVHVSVNVPLKGPVYCPFHVPDTSTVGGAWVADGVGVGTAVGTAVGGAVAHELVLGVGVPLVEDEPHAVSAIAARTTAELRNRWLDIASASRVSEPVADAYDTPGTPVMVDQFRARTD